MCICRDSTFRIWAILFVHCPNSVMESRQNRVDCNIFQGQFHFFQSRNQHFCRIFLQKSTQNYHFTTKFYKKNDVEVNIFSRIFLQKLTQNHHFTTKFYKKVMWKWTFNIYHAYAYFTKKWHRNEHWTYTTFMHILQKWCRNEHWTYTMYTYFTKKKFKPFHMTFKSSRHDFK